VKITAAISGFTYGYRARTLNIHRCNAQQNYMFRID